MNQAITGFLEYLKIDRKKSGNTLAAYGTDLGKLASYLEQKFIYDFTKITITDLNAYILFLEKDGMATSTISRNISSIKSFFDWMFYERMIDRNPARDLKAPRVVPIKKEYVETVTLRQLESLPDTDTNKGKRDRAIIAMLCRTGIKTTELINLKTTDVNLLLRTVRLEENGIPRMINFDEELRTFLDSYMSILPLLNKQNNDNILFVNMNGGHFTRQGLWKVIKEYAAMAGLSDVITPNTIRASFLAHTNTNGGTPT